MKTFIKYYFFILLLVFSSCQKREWNNPFDPECPKVLFTPTNFNAVQEGATIKLTWIQPVSTISKFKLVRQVSGGQETSLPEQAKDKQQYVDPFVFVGGKVIVYWLIASAGTNESNPVSVSITPITNPPSVSTTALTILTTSTATSGGIVTSDGASTITARGVCWSTSPNPTITNSRTSDAIGTGTGSYTSSLSGLTANTTYYVRAYATNAVGTAYGIEVNFKTLNLNEVADIDGNIYHTVTIGTQVWMVENLKTTKYNDGASISNVTDNNTWSGLSTPAYCWYKNDVAYKSIYGALYNWHAVNTKKLCPTGWHVPTDNEWTTLTIYLGGETVAGGKLKEAGTSHWASPNTGATNESGFTALPAGGRYGIGAFINIGNSGVWWSSTESSTNNAWNRTVTYVDSNVYRYLYNKEDGFSIRCVRD